MRKWPDWFTYGRPFFHYWGAAVMLVLSIVGICLSAWQIWKTGLPWWGWMLVAFGALALLIYAHMRQWRQWNNELRLLRLRLGGTIRLAWQEEMPSRYPEDYPYGRRAVLQTTRPLQPTSLQLVCSQPIKQDLMQVTFAGHGSYFMATSLQETLSAVVPINITSPPFKPENSLVVELFGPRPFEILGVNMTP